jgi:hypothetical protein
MQRLNVSYEKHDATENCRTAPKENNTATIHFLN